MGSDRLDHLGRDRRPAGLRVRRARGDVPRQAGRPLRVRAGRLAQVLLAGRADRRVRLLVRVVERARRVRDLRRAPADHGVRWGGLLRHHDVRRARGHPADQLGRAHRRHVHRPVLPLQHPRHAAGGLVQLRRGRAHDPAGGRDRDRRLHHRRLLEPSDQLELPRRDAHRLRRSRQRVPPVRARDGLAVHHRVVDVRARSRRDVRSRVQGHEERHAQGARGDGRRQRRARVLAADRRARDDRLRRHPRRRCTASPISWTCSTRSRARASARS